MVAVHVVVVVAVGDDDNKHFGVVLDDEVLLALQLKQQAREVLVDAKNLHN